MSACTRNSLVFIDAQLPDLATLRSGLPKDLEVHLLDPHRAGLKQIASALEGRQDIPALHLITHGAPGKLFLGNTALGLGDLQGHADELDAIADALAEDGELLIYGCEVAAGREGRQFIGALTEMTGLKVAAATHKVGHTSLGASWNLDLVTSMMISQPISAVSWQQTLSNITLTNEGFEAGLGDSQWTAWSDSGTSEVVSDQEVETDDYLWTVIPSGTKMLKLVPGDASGGEDLTETAAALGLSIASVDYLKTVFDTDDDLGTIDQTSFAYTFREVTLAAGDVVSMAWNYIATDYAPFNDASFASFVRVVEGLPVITGKVNDVKAEVGLLGATVAGTSNWTTGDFGSTGWQTVSFSALEAGTYRIGFAVFNLDDTSYSPHLYIDEAPGQTRKDGEEFSPVAPDPNAPPPAAPVLTYSSTSFAEAEANDGSITGTITLTLAGDTFTGSDDDDWSSLVTKVPDGLTAVLTRTSGTTATLTLTGNSTSHANSNDVNDLTVTFTDVYFTGGDASAVSNATKSDLAIDFQDPPPGPPDLISGLGGDDGFGENDYVREDDPEDTDGIDLTSVFGVNGVKFGANWYTKAYINNNGMITFGAAATAYDPNGLSSGVISDVTDELVPAIALYWTDIDTSEDPVTESLGGTSTGANLVHWDVDTINKKITITWNDVEEYGYTGTNTPVLAGQIILTDAGNGNMDIQFRYEYADGLQETPVTAGWNVGVSGGVSGVDYFEIPLAAGTNVGDLDALADLDEREGNSGELGIWNFFLRDGGVAGKAISYSATTFEEAGANNGSITGTIALTLAGETFTGSNGADWSSLVSNVPAGLTAVLTRTSDITATLSLTGNATTHVNASDVSDLTVTFADAYFTGGDASAVGNATKSDLAINFNDPAPVSSGASEPSTPPDTPTTIDGAIVTTGTTTTSDGRTVEVVTIAPINSDRVESTGGAATADIPLFFGNTSATIPATTASLPIGVGLTSTGARTPANNTEALATLIQLVKDTAGEAEAQKNNMTGGGEKFLAALDRQAEKGPLIVNSVKLNVAEGTTAVPDKPITIEGSAEKVAGTNGRPVEAIVIDVRDLPKGTKLELKNVEFAVIVGDGIEVIGGNGQNIVYAGTGSQRIVLGEGDDELHGGDGDDAIGSEGGNDLLHGDAGNDTVFGGDGDDTLWGGAGDDDLSGDAGSDTASYSDAASAVKVSLAKSGWQKTGGAGKDKLKDIENLTGSDFNDTLKGSKFDNVLEGGAGKDNLSAGKGVDTASYASALSGVTVAIKGGWQETGGAGRDKLSGFENLLGSAFDDTLTGGRGSNVLTGGLGVDTLTGGAGADQFRYEAANEGGDRIADFVSGQDKLVFVGSEFGDLAAGALAAEAFVSGAGAVAGTAGQLFLFDTVTGRLFFDADGSGAGEAVLIATLTGVSSLNAQDILIA